MEFKRFLMDGPVEIIPRRFGDARGYFFESYSYRVFAENGISTEFVQDNQSVSQRGVLRGLHFQKPPYAQAKLVRVAAGRALDIAVDIRKNSPTYGQHIACELDAEKNNMFFIPEGFAHGFAALTDNTIFMYKCSHYYNPAAEGGLLWNDPALGINWELTEPILSPKDIILPKLQELDSGF
ncbi:dTDP-4-dehydrorhamnose 3,5-epimerase [Adhaeribacter radiodurans]|uniref:dTDP-4-dehydrorhamnose 3,5-epimerase n=1 Tax=Adhaeribacter radiodurans TaxID=2745197 RepID=A0A7L7LDV5_9BACT|nr:dTDP-4-dehydrorhamnose 3,5-epimerase [Adhaeribacter radiodurans]QMU30599.1 dTDP-4-dehydrorhamnose 3,5-epimerase [Adhaeribacter radiodurans]